MSRRDADRGETLIEILVALAVLGIAITALMGALGVNASTTIVNRSQAQISASLLHGAEYVKSLSFTTLCTGSTTWVDVPTGAVPHDDAKFDIRYRTAEAFGQPATACDPSTGGTGTTLASVRVEVAGDGFVARYVEVPIRRQLP